MESNSKEKDLSSNIQPSLDVETMKINEYNNITNNKDIKEEGKIENASDYNQNLISGAKDEELKLRKQSSLLFENGELKIPLKSDKKYTKNDFEILRLSGKGAYGTVLQAYLKTDEKKKFLGIKVMDISSMIKVNKLYQAYLEAELLNEMKNPYIVGYYGAYESNGKIHLVMDYLSRGDFSDFLKINFPLKDETVRFYSAQIVSFLEYFQSKMLVHRDLKPENIMIDKKCHLKMIDFATVKKLGYYFDKKQMTFKEENDCNLPDTDDIKGKKLVVNPDKEEEEEEEEVDDNEEGDDNENDNNFRPKRKRSQRRMTFVGTAEYVSPEVIKDEPAGFGADIWAFGVMLYRMYYGKTPFKSSNEYLTFKNIENPKINFPDEIKVDENAKDLILKILVRDPNNRLGAGEKGTPNDIEHLKSHPYFNNINWNKLTEEETPYKDEFKFSGKKEKSNKKKDKESSPKKDNQENEEKKATTIKEGIVNKKTFWFYYSKRFIILDDTPKITIMDPDKKIIKRKIILNKESRIEHPEPSTLEVTAGEYIFRFKAINQDCTAWMNAIKEAIEKYAK